MSKRLILILTLAFVAGIAFAAYAEVQNVKVSGDILVQGVSRRSFFLEEDVDGTTDSDTKTPNNAILSAARVRVDADLTDNVSATVRLLNERAWGTETVVSSTDVDLDLAYVTLKEFLYSPLTMVIGRQGLRYGNALIIGDPDTNAIASSASALPSTLTDLSVRKAFDAIKAVLNYDPLVVDLVYFKPEENTTNVEDDVSVMGLNAAYTVNPNLLVEGYLWSRNRDYGSTGITVGVLGATVPGQNERLNTIGGRGVYTGIKNLMLGLEGAWQFGDHVTSTVLYPGDARATGRKSDVTAYAIQLTSAYMLPRRFSPVLSGSYTYLSGDKDQNVSDNYTGWSPMFEDQAGGTIFNKILGYSNAQLLNIAGQLKPVDDVTVKLDWYHIRLVREFNDGGAASGAVARTLSGVFGDPTLLVKTGKMHLADEIDLGITYDYTEDVQFGLLGGIYFPGAVYDKRDSNDATQLIGSMKVTF